MTFWNKHFQGDNSVFIACGNSCNFHVKNTMINFLRNFEKKTENPMYAVKNNIKTNVSWYV